MKPIQVRADKLNGTMGITFSAWEQTDRATSMAAAGFASTYDRIRDERAYQAIVEKFPSATAGLKRDGEIIFLK